MFGIKTPISLAGSSGARLRRGVQDAAWSDSARARAHARERERESERVCVRERDRKEVEQRGGESVDTLFSPDA